MRKRIKTTPAKRFYGRLGKVPVAVSVERHAHKAKGTKTGLSAEGISAARKKGLSYPPGFKSKGYASSVSRADTTLQLGQTYARRRGTKTYALSRTRMELDLYKIIKDMPAIEKELEKAGQEEPFLRKWLDGKVSARIIDKPKLVADRIIKKRIGLGKAVFELGAKDKLLRNVSHSWVVEAVFERLTGRKFQFTTPKNKMVRSTEGLTVSFTRQGKAVLSYRGKAYDVTANLEKIAGKERIEKIVETVKQQQRAAERLKAKQRAEK